MPARIKKILFSILSIFLFSLLVASPSYAQNQVSDFEYQYEKYRNLYPVYETKRNEYLKHQTLAAQNEAVAVTQDILIQRAQVLRTYLTALKYKINSNGGVDLTEKSKLSAELDNIIGWLQNHMDSLEDINNPNSSQLFEISARLEKRQKDIRIISHQALGTNLIGKVRSLYAQYVTNINNFEPYVAKAEDASYLDNWMNESQSDAYTALQSIKRAEEALEMIDKTGGSETQTLQLYTKIQDETEDARRNLKKGVEHQKEIVKALKETLPKEEVQPDGEDKPSLSEEDNNDQPSDSQQEDTENQATDTTKQLGYITNIKDIDGVTNILFDDIQWLEGEQAKQELISNGCDIKETDCTPPNGFLIVNKETKKVKYQLSADIQISIFEAGKPQDAYTATVDEFQAKLEENSAYRESIPFEIQVKDNRVYYITQKFVP